LFVCLLGCNGWTTPARGFFEWPYGSIDEQSDAKWSLWFFGNVTPGTVHEYQATYKSRLMHHVFPLQKNRKVKYAEFHFSAPTDFAFYANVHGGYHYSKANIKYRTARDPNHRNHTLHIWTAQNIPPAKAQYSFDQRPMYLRGAQQKDLAGLSARIEIAPKAFFYQNKRYEMKSWKDIAAFEQELMAKSINVTPKLKRAAQDIVKDASTPKQKARRLFRFIQHHVRFLPRSDSEHEWHPATAEQVYTQRYGTSREKAVLYHTMLKAVGVRSVIARIRTRDAADTIDKKFISPFDFNHTLNYLPKIDGGRYVDTCALDAQFDTLPFSSQNTAVLLLQGPRTQLTQTPNQGPTHNLHKQKLHLEFVSKQKVKGQLHITLRGRPRIQLNMHAAHGFLKDGVNQRLLARKWLRRSTQAFVQGTRINSVSIQDLDKPTAHIRIQFTAKPAKKSRYERQFHFHFQPSKPFQNQL
ncbi:MAG: transglutaminase-like domain-containing protein, partial [Myxococcota bacterium]